MCAVWGLHFVVIKVGVNAIPPIFYAAIRMTLVAAVLSPFLRWRPHNMLRILIAGLCMGALNYAFMFSGVKLATASAAAIAIQLYMPFATVLAMIFLNDHMGWRRVLGIGLAFAGVAVIALGSKEAPGSQTHIALGVGLVAVGAFLEAIGAIIVKQLKAFKPFELLAWFSLIGAIGLWSITAIFEHGQARAFAVADKSLIISAIAYSAIGGSIIGHSAYYWLLQRLPVSTVASSLPLTMVFGVISGILILGDPVSAGLVIGSLMTFAGVGVVIFRTAKKTDIKPPLKQSGVSP
jgi:O-acetylserine/cysteine efflux transporter